MKLYEDVVHSRLSKYLKGPEKLVFREFPFLSRVVDTVVYDCKTDELIAIEIKLNKLKALLEQISFCGHFADRTFIVIPKSTYIHSDKYKNLARNIGVITFEPAGKKLIFDCTIKPTKSPTTNRKLREIAKNLLKQHYKRRICDKF